MSERLTIPGNTKRLFQFLIDFSAMSLFVSSLQQPAQGWAVKLSLSSSCQPLFLALTWPAPVSVCSGCCTECFHVPSLRPCPARGEFGPNDLAGAVQCQRRGGLDAAPAAASSCSSCSSSPSSLRLFRALWLLSSLSITSALHSAGAWLQGFSPHFTSSQLSCSFPARLGFDLCFPWRLCGQRRYRTIVGTSFSSPLLRGFVPVELGFLFSAISVIYWCY